MMHFSLRLLLEADSTVLSNIQRLIHSLDDAYLHLLYFETQYNTTSIELAAPIPNKTIGRIIPGIRLMNNCSYLFCNKSVSAFPKIRKSLIKGGRDCKGTKDRDTFSSKVLKKTEKTKQLMEKPSDLQV